MTPATLPPIERLLLVRNDRLGDLVLSLPAFAAARRALPEARITALVSPATASLLAHNPHIDEVLVDVPQASGWTLGRRLAEHDFDAAFVLNTNTRNCLAVWRAGIPLRVTWAYKPAGLLLGNRLVRVHRNRPPIHEAQFALQFVRQLGLPVDMSASSVNLEVDPAARQQVVARIQRELGGDGPLLGVHPGNFQSAYNWPLSRYAELVSRLAEHGRVMVTGGPSEAALLADVRRQAVLPLGARVGFFHDLSLSELVAAIAQQDVLTVSSTGPMHLAGALGTPVVALFSRHPAHSPAKWRPLGERHVILQPELRPGENPRIPKSQGTVHMEGIAVDTVVAANLSSS